MATSEADGAVRGAPLLWLRLEGGAALGASILGFAHAGVSWWWFGALFLVPDISMAGYLINPKWGAAGYNIVHTYTAPAILAGIGVLSGARAPWWLALIWAAHIGFDRMLGYGLKYPAAFGSSHLGRLRARSD